MNAHLMIGSASYSLAKECKRLCDNEVRVNDVKGHRKNQKERRKKEIIKKILSLTR